MMDDDSTSFGFRKVSKDKRQTLVNEVFSSVANRYDVMNNVMSAGVHHLWKDKLVSKIPNLSGKILDVAGGTGDISFRIHKKATKLGLRPDITICDINPEMLKEGRSKAINKNILSGVEFVLGNAESLPFADNSFDYYIISFGIRNVTNIDKALLEAHRVLKPGGKFLCLEFSKVNNPIIEKLYDSYSLSFIPKIGKMIANDEEAYKYLVESIREFPSQKKFLKMIEEAGFVSSKYDNMTAGITSIHTGFKKI